MSDTTLIHSGPGDNVAGSKILNIGTYNETITATTPDSLKKPVRAILDAINNRNFDAAREKIKFIESMGGLETEVTELLTILKIKCEHTSNPNFEIDLKEITKTLRTSENKIVKDLALSLILSVESTTNEIEKAKIRFQQSKDVGPHSKAVALAFFSTKEELIELYRNDKDNISEVELHGIIEGLTRLKCFVEAQQVAEYLKESFDNYNSKYAALFTKALVFNESIQKRDYWLLTQSEKDEVDSLLNEALQIYEDSECSDSRLFSLFFPSLIFTKFSSDELIDVCKENIDKAEIFAKEYADEIRVSLRAGDVSDSHPKKILEKICSNDKDKEEKINEIIKLNEADNLTFWIAEKIVPDDDFKAWIDNGVTIIGDFSDFEKKLNALRVLLLSSNDAELDTCIESLLKNPKPEHEHINSEFIQNLSELLYKRGKENEACDILLYFLSDVKEIWCSPLIQYTLFKLHNTARHKDVISLIDKVSDKEKPIQVLNVIVWTHLYYGSAQQALDEANKIINNDDLTTIDLKFKALYKLGMFTQIDEVISTLDYSIFTNPIHITLEIIKILIERKNFKLVESIIIDWFKESLENNYYYISQACLQIIMSKNANNFKPSYNINGLERAVQYLDGDKSIFKIISSDDNSFNRHTLTANSILAKAFKNKEIGDEIVSGIKHLKIQDFLPPFVAIKHLASEIRNESNDGSDAFQILRLSEDPAIMIEQFSKYIPHHDIDNHLFTQKEIPLAIRMNLINKNEPVKSAMLLLQNQDTKFEALINGGKNIENDACTDIITIMYLCLTSTSQYFVKNAIKLHLTQDNIDDLKNWVNYVESINSATVSKDENGKIHWIPSELVKKFNANVIANLKCILPLLHVLPIVPDNYHKTFTDNIKLWGHRCVKSLYAMKNSDIPMFSIDTQTCWFMVHLFKITPINPYKLIGDAASKLSISQRENLVTLHAINGLPFPILEADFINLACSHADHEGDILCKLLNNYVGLFNDELKASDFLAKIFDCYFRKSVMNNLASWKFKNLHLTAFNNPYGPKVDRVFNLCCRIVMKHKYASSEISAEEKLAKFIASLAPFVFSKPNSQRFITTLFSLYIQGHFLDMNETNKKAMEIIDS